MYACIKKAYFRFHSPHWDCISREAKAFTTALLTADPSRRMTSAQALEHEWLAGPNQNHKNDLTGNLSNLKQFNARRHLKAGIALARLAARTTAVVGQPTTT